LGEDWEEGVWRCLVAIRTHRVRACQEGLGWGCVGGVWATELTSVNI